MNEWMLPFLFDVQKHNLLFKHKPKQKIFFITYTYCEYNDVNYTYELWLVGLSLQCTRNIVPSYS